MDATDHRGSKRNARPDIDAALVERLVRSQFPHWAGLPVRPVEFGGWDNRTFRLGDGMSARLPSDAGYAPQVDKEHLWLPRLAPQLPLAIPVPVAKGIPGEGYPYNWSVYRWLDGASAVVAQIDDPAEFARTLADFLIALQQTDPTGGPPAGAHSFFRGGPLETYDDETRRALEALDGQVDTRISMQIWDTGLHARWDGRPVWFHGDVAAGNLLVREGRLSAVIDFGCCGVGDPACDLVIAWTLFEENAQDVFRSALSLDDATWARGRSWALWKALITLVGSIYTDQTVANAARRVIAAVIADHRRSG